MEEKRKKKEREKEKETVAFQGHVLISLLGSTFLIAIIIST